MKVGIFNIGIHQTAIIGGLNKSSVKKAQKKINQENEQLENKLDYCFDLLDKYNAGTIVALKNGNAFLDGGLQIWLNGKREKVMCYAVYINKDGIIEDDIPDVNGKNFIDFVNHLCKSNPLLRLDSTMTMGYAHTEEMVTALNRLNTRGGALNITLPEDC